MATSVLLPVWDMTVRDKILYRLLHELANLEGDQNGNLFQDVIFGDTEDIDAARWPIAGIMEGDEEVQDQLFPLIQKQLTVMIEFRWPFDLGVDNFARFRYYLGRLQKALFGTHEAIHLISDEYPQGLTQDVQEVGSSPAIEGRTDSSPSGILTLIIKYRHVNGDPYKQFPDD